MVQHIYMQILSLVSGIKSRIEMDELKMPGIALSDKCSRYMWHFDA